MSKEQSIVDELRGKIEDYESNMSSWLEESNTYADLYRIKPPNRKSNAYSNPRLPEMHRAVEALSTTVYSMLFAKDPFFELRLMDFDVPSDNVYWTQKTLELQCKRSRYQANALRGLRSLITFGTVFVEEPFEWMQLNPFGRKIPVTKFIPRAMVQMGFDRSALDINEADWKYTNDLIGKSQLLRMSDTDVMKSGWIKKNINESLNDKTEETSQFLRSRLARNGYNTFTPQSGAMMEFVSYYGPLDSMNDRNEYICGIVNRKWLVKIAANPDQTGRGNFRVAKWIDFEADPLGFGLGRLLGRAHRSMDANRQKSQDLLSFGAYNIWMKSNLAGINAQDCVLRPNKIIAADDINGMKQLVVDTSAVNGTLKLEDMLKQDFRAASGATDTLQAIITEATASEVSLAQNEAFRRLSVYTTSGIAEPFLREHLEKMHNNNRMNVAEPFVIGTDSGPKRLYPKDLNIDVDIEVKIVTDKDYRPKRTENILQAIQLATSIRQESPDKYRIDTIPLYQELIRGLDMDPSNIIRSNDEAAKIAVLTTLMGRGQGMAEAPVPPEESAAGAVGTPIGPVPGSPVPEAPSQEMPAI